MAQRYFLKYFSVTFNVAQFVGRSPRCTPWYRRLSYDFRVPRDYADFTGNTFYEGPVQRFLIQSMAKKGLSEFTFGRLTWRE